MSFLDYFRAKDKQAASASLAKERLQIIIAHERGGSKSAHDFPLQQLRRELLAVIGKYVHIDHDEVKVGLEHSGETAILELNVPLPEEAFD